MSKTAVVIDMNKIYSALIKPSSKIVLSITHPSYQFFAPNFIIVELLLHIADIRALSPLNEEEFALHLKELIERIKFVVPEAVDFQHHLAAFEICKGVDPKDTPYVALALHLNAKLWSGDKKLREGLLAKGVDVFIEL
jgi:predicted nucleic acid-binding protein